MTRLLRTVAIAIAAAALIDPSIGATRQTPVTVRIHLPAGDPAAQSVRDRLQAALGPHVAMESGPVPRIGDRSRIWDLSPNAAAVVVVDGAADASALQAGVPVSTVSLDESPDVAIADAPDTLTSVAGRPLDVPVTLAGRGVAGLTSTVALEDRGVEVARVEHTWTGEGRASVVLPYVAAGQTPSVMQIRVDGVPGERRLANNRADVRVLPAARRFDVAVVEPRPSWAAGFVRRALEADPALRVSSVLHVSRGIAAHAEEPPRRLAAEDLARFDVLIVGAPDELRDGEVQAIGEFASVRGGAVILLPDRRPAGAYTRLFPEPLRSAPSSGLTERLLRGPETLKPAGIVASEIVSARSAGTIPSVFATTADDEPVVFGWPMGDGQLIFSGALDGWRYRGEQGSTFERFWRATTVSAAFAAPPRLQLTLTPSVVRPNQPARLTVRLRRTEIEAPSASSGGQLPGVAAQIVAADGSARTIRLWPTSDASVLAGDVRADEPGASNIRAAAETGASSDTTLFVDANAGSATALLDFSGIPAQTGGVAVSASNLTPLIDHLKSLSRPDEQYRVHPMRSAWWMVPFAAAACAEWTIRRRRGLR